MSYDIFCFVYHTCLYRWKFYKLLWSIFYLKIPSVFTHPFTLIGPI